MNRIHHPAQSVDEGASRPSFEIQTSLFTPPAHDTSHSLFAPLHYEPRYAYPLIVWMHAPGTMGERELSEIMPALSIRNYVAVAPRGFPGGQEEAGLGLLDWPQTEEFIEEAERRVFHAVEAACRQCHVAGRRIFMAGFGTGGTMAFRVAMNHPNRFAGVVSLCGGFPRGLHPLAQLHVARRLPLFLVVGRDSLEYPPAEACDDLRLFHSAGMSVALRQYPCGQVLAKQMLRDVDRWIIDEITSPGDPPAAPADDPWQCWSD
jgi:phospholipase/carboxylesterase